MRSVSDTRYRDAGITTGIFFRDVRPSSRQLQGFLCDLLPGDDILKALLECINRPSFTRLQDLAASGAGEAQLSALLNELGSIYLPTIVSNIQEFMRGYLALPKTKRINADRNNRVLKNIFHITPARSAKKHSKEKIYNSTKAYILAFVIAATGGFYYWHTRQERIDAGKDSSLQVAPNTKADTHARAQASRQIAKSGETTNKPAKDVQDQPSRPNLLPSTSDENTGPSLVMKMVPMIRQAVAEGSEIKLNQEEQYDDCMVLIRAYREMTTHRATLGWYKVDLCNHHVQDITDKPNEF